VLLAAFWPVGVLTCLVWLGMALMMRMSSLAALTSALAAPLLAYAFGQEAVAMLALFLAVLLYWRHKDNIGRILTGEEPKIGAKKA
jgi:glycerol-3-phosphate acyltransferase PlsY